MNSDSDRLMAGTVSSTAYNASNTNTATTTNVPMPGYGPTVEEPQPEQQSVFKQSSHPIALIFHYLFRTLAIIFFLVGGAFLNSILQLVLIVLMAAFDFWTVKNITGRLLVGLRWWNDVKEDGSTSWVFESRQNRRVNAVDQRLFWTGLYAYPIAWLVLTIVDIFRLQLVWLPACFLNFILTGSNLTAYMKCEKDQKNKIQQWQTGVVSGMMGSFISNRLGGLFGGGSRPAATV